MADVRSYAGTPPVSAFADMGAPFPGGTPIVVDTNTGLCYTLIGGVVTQVGSVVTPSALTKTDDTNVTLTLGGSPTTALLAATSLTLGWTGTLAATRGGTGLTETVAFLAYNSTTATNQTGNGADATVPFDTEVFDLGSDFASNTFTAPVDGRYLLSYMVSINSVDNTADDVRVQLITSNRTYIQFRDATNNLFNNQILTFSMLCDMDAADTASINCRVRGMAGNTCGIVGSVSMQTSFSGYLTNAA